jgi:hypothetical protein
MKFLSNFNLFEAYLTDHFKKRYDLRGLNFEFESGVDDLTQEDLQQAKTKIVEILEKGKKNLESYDLEWNYGNEDTGFIFNFGDIVLKKGDKYYYPRFRVLGEEGDLQNSYTGSVFCAVAYSNGIITFMVYPRRCQYFPGGKCIDPLDYEFTIKEVRRNKEHDLRLKKRQGAPYEISFAPETDKHGRKIWNRPKFNLIHILSKEEQELEALNTKRREFITKVNNIKTTKTISIGKYISYLVDHLPVTKLILGYKNIGSSKDPIVQINFFGGGKGPEIKKFTKGDKILVEISKITKVPEDMEALSLGYKYYIAEIERYQEVKGKDPYFACRIIGGRLNNI